MRANIQGGNAYSKVHSTDVHELNPETYYVVMVFHRHGDLDEVTFEEKVLYDGAGLEQLVLRPQRNRRQGEGMTRLRITFPL